MDEEHDGTAESAPQAKTYEEMLADVRSALAAKGIALACPRCGSQRWDFRGYTAMHISQDPYAIDLDAGRRAVALCCTNCGFYSAHDAEVLGLTF